MKRTVGTLLALCSAFFCLSSEGREQTADASYRAVSIADISRRTPFNACVTTHGTVVDAYPDDTDRDYVFMILRDGSDSVYVAVKFSRRRDFAEIVPLIGARVEVKAQVQDFVISKHMHMGRSLVVLGMENVKVISPAPDQFDVPELEDMSNAKPQDIAGTDRRRIRGLVVARWEPNSFLIRTGQHRMAATNMVMRIDCINDALPQCGESVEVTGFPETDLHRINMARALWRPTETVSFPEEDAVGLKATDIVSGAGDARSYDYLLHGRLVRLPGTVMTHPDAYARERVIYLDGDGVTVPVEISSIERKLAELAVGSIVEVTGVCVFDIDNWRPNAAFPQIKGFRIVPSSSADIRVVKTPSWWTAERLATALGVLLFALAGVVVWNMTLRRLVERRGRELAEESVAHAESELKVLERTRLAVELHDSISQLMTGSAMEIRAATQSFASNAPGTAAHLNVALQAINSARGELRNCIWDLRNNALESNDPNDAIALALAPHLGETKLQLRFNVPRERLSDNTMHMIICIVRELAVNAIRHGGATEVKVAGAVEDGRLLCSVRDNGCGFAPGQAPGMEEGHFGLQGIRERLKERGGSLTIQSAPGEGTKATLVIRLTSENAP